MHSEIINFTDDDFVDYTYSLCISDFGAYIILCLII